MERALAADPALRARRADIAAHLARYDALDAPPPPPFAALAARLDGERRAAPRGPRLAWAVAAAAAVLLAAFALHGSSRDEPPSFRAGEGLRAMEAGAWIAEGEPAEGWIGEGVHVVLDRGARLVPESADACGCSPDAPCSRSSPTTAPSWSRRPAATCACWAPCSRSPWRGRPSSSPWARAASRPRVACWAADEALQEGRVGPAPHAAGAFYRRPDLRLAVVGTPVPGEPVTLRFTFANPGRVPFYAGRARTGYVPPCGSRSWTRRVDVHDLAVPGVDAQDGPLPPGRPLRLAGRAETSFTARLGRPFGERGTYRCRALYRPEGQPSRVSDTLLLEVR